MSSTQKTDVQMLADAVEVGGRPGGNRRLAAAELRRLDAENQQLRAQLDQAVASKCELLEAAKMVLAWHDAETDPSGTTFWERVEMCRESEDALRTAVEKATGVEP